MRVNPEDRPPDIYATWSNPRMADFENKKKKFTHIHDFTNVQNVRGNSISQKK